MREGAEVVKGFSHKGFSHCSRAKQQQNKSGRARLVTLPLVFARVFHRAIRLAADEPAAYRDLNY